VLQHYHFDSTCIIHYIDQKRVVFDVDLDISREISKIVNRIKRNKNLALVFSNPALGEVFTKYVEIMSIVDKKKRVSEIDYINPIDSLIDLKSRLGNRLILGFYGDLKLINIFVSSLESVDKYLSDVDKLILANAALDTSATKLYTTDREMIYSARKLESAIVKLRKEYFKVNTRLDIVSP